MYSRLPMTGERNGKLAALPPGVSGVNGPGRPPMFSLVPTPVGVLATPTCGSGLATPDDSRSVYMNWPTNCTGKSELPGFSSYCPEALNVLRLSPPYRLGICVVSKLTGAGEKPPW